MSGEQVLSRNVIFTYFNRSGQETTCNDFNRLYVTEKNNNSTDTLSVHRLKLKRYIVRIIKRSIILLTIYI